MLTPDYYIKKFNMVPHGEGGWYTRTWRAADGKTERGHASLIYFLLEEDQRSAWHRFDAEEMWLWHAGANVVVTNVIDETGKTREQTIGPENPQAFVGANLWQTAAPVGGWALMTCVASPGFDEKGWELAPESWRPGKS